MKEISEEAYRLVTEAQIIADSLARYNPGLRNEKVPLDVLSASIGTLISEYEKLRTDIGQKIQENNEKI